MIPRLAFALVLALASPAFAQEARDSLAPAPYEPPAAPGTVVLRFANVTACPLAIQVAQNGAVIGRGLIKPHAATWLHFQAGHGVFEVVVIVHPKFCELDVPSSSPAPQPAPDRGTVRALEVARVGPRR